MQAMLRDRFPLLLAALWWGSLTAVGFVVVPMLFAYLPSAMVAGNMAAKLFTAQSWIAVACVVPLMVLTSGNRDKPMGDAASTTLMFLLGGLLLALLVEYGVSPRIVARVNVRLWHGVGTAMYLIQWLCALAVLWRLAKPQASDRPD